MSVDIAFATALRKRLTQEKQKSLEIVGGGRVADFSEYRFSCGYIKCIDDVDVLINEIIEDMQRS